MIVTVTTSVLVALAILILALVLDLIIGDPSPNYPEKIRFKLHPTVWMGNFTHALEPHFKNANPKIEKFNGILLGLTVILTFTIPTYFGLKAVFTYLGLLAYIIIAVIVLKITICLKLETDWGIAAAKAIKENDLEEARQYAHFSRRNNKELTGSQIASSVIESVAENLTDFRLSPMFYFAFFGVPGAIAFRAINTLDGMVGFKDKEHINIGWFSAVTDTIVNYIPARLTAVLIIVAGALLGEDYNNGWRIALRDQTNTPSRNHGWQMAAIAGVLNVQLEKPGQYVVGDPTEQLNSEHILRTLKIRNVVCVIFILLIVLPILFSVNLLLAYLPFI
jgi:adenosylcobinamide-phosphate synthase